MTTESFAYWLQGFVELNGGKMPTEEQWKSIVEHLSIVFVKVTPPLSSPENQKYCNFNQVSSPMQTNVGGISGMKIPIVAFNEKNQPLDLNQILITC